MTSSSTLVMPVEGTWRVLTPPGHQKHGRDLMAAQPDGRLFAGKGIAWVTRTLPVDRFFGWERPVHSPSEGNVVRAVDGIRDRESSNLILSVTTGFLWTPLRYRNQPDLMAGNHVIIEANVGFILLAHLRCGSVTVQEGETVRPGRPVGLVGNSGNSAAPHLHLHVSRRPDGGGLIPFGAHQFALKQRDGWKVEQNADLPRTGLIHTPAVPR